MNRRSELAKIHIGKKELRLDEDAYRDFLFSLTGIRSSADLDERDRRKVIKEMRRLGVEFHRKGRVGKKRRRTVPDEKRPLLSKITALRAESGRPVEYAEAILRRMTGHPHRTPLSWGSPEQLRKVAAALSYDQRRRARRAKEGA